MERTKLEVRPREGRGTKDAKALRAAGEVPGVLYGGRTNDGEALPVIVNVRALRDATSGPGGIHSILDLAIDGKARPAMIKELQLHPVRDLVMHVDFQEVRLDRAIHTVVSVHLEGTPHGVTMGGVLSAPTHDLNIEALPGNIPEQITVDVSGLEVNEAIRLGDLTPPDGVTFLDDPNGTILATVTAPTVEEEPEPEEGAEPGAEPGEGEAEAEAGAGEPEAESSEE